ncbi:hypothetical protein PR003_g21332 [Phytophthora rubi]|uniref:Uncharacterized protein n=1 Tax=Phytophthora rubi TaxID=129364 RepID=A0A6A4DQL0_9STRA|nr:hypothetical protein PR003_g21332 [Phytophthora rubi]
MSTHRGLSTALSTRGRLSDWNISSHNKISMEAWRARLIRVLAEFEELDDAESSDMLVLHALRGAEGVITHPVKKQRGGSVPGRAANVDRDREAGHARLIADYFAPNPVYNSRLFRRRFRMPPAMFDIVLEGVLEADDYFVQKKDALAYLVSRRTRKSQLRCACVVMVSLPTRRMSTSALLRLRR